MEDEKSEIINISTTSNLAYWRPTTGLRWYETDNYNPVKDAFDKVLQQKWLSSEGEVKWEEIEVFGR